MKQSIAILISCLFIHIQLIINFKWLENLTDRQESPYFGIAQGISHLLYPVCGWIADVYVKNRLQLIRSSYIVMLIGSLLGFIILLIKMRIQNSAVVADKLSIGLFIVFITGIGLYEANAIQFGMDQMLEASSEQLSSFIHWYFWCTCVGPLLLFYTIAGTIWIFSLFCDIQIQHTKHNLQRFYLIILSIQALISILAIVILHKSKEYFDTNQTFRNPLKLIIQVLRYSHKHKVPEQRSAFTYWENKIPSRIDLGKQKYGGPFTYEQVEDVKTFFRLLLLIISLFGLQLMGDGYSMTYYTTYTSGCPSLLPFLLVTANPQHISSLVTIIGVPCLHLLKKHARKYIPSMLARVFSGLVICLLNEALQVILSLLIYEGEFNCPEIDGLLPVSHLQLKCLLANLKVMRNTSESCEYICDGAVTSPTVNSIIVIAPLVLCGLSYLLIFMTTLEFICAQSPNAVKGLLIGIWYSMLSIKFIIINNLDTNSFMVHTFSWSIYHGIKGFSILLSIICFSIVCKYYQYRQRDEIVNEQNIIEEQYDRELRISHSDESDESEANSD